MGIYKKVFICSDFYVYSVYDNGSFPSTYKNSSGYNYNISVCNAFNYMRKSGKYDYICHGRQRLSYDKGYACKSLHEFPRQVYLQACYRICFLFCYIDNNGCTCFKQSDAVCAYSMFKTDRRDACHYYI